MSNCKCGRELRDGEVRCPACKSKSDSVWKPAILGAVTAVVAVLGALFFGGKNGGNGGGQA
jgi:hypothetical protein